MNIYNYFKEQQKNILKLLGDLSTINDKEESIKALDSIYLAIYLYTKVEDKVLYDPLKARAGELEIIVEVGDYEHKFLLNSIDIIRAVRFKSKEWTSLITFMKNFVTHHSGQMEDQIFELAAEHFTTQELGNMLDEAMVYNKQLLAEFETALA